MDLKINISKLWIYKPKFYKCCILKKRAAIIRGNTVFDYLHHKTLSLFWNTSCNTMLRTKIVGLHVDNFFVSFENNVWLSLLCNTKLNKLISDIPVCCHLHPSCVCVDLFSYQWAQLPFYVCVDNQKGQKFSVHRKLVLVSQLEYYMLSFTWQHNNSACRRMWLSTRVCLEPFAWSDSRRWWSL